MKLITYFGVFIFLSISLNSQEIFNETYIPKLNSKGFYKKIPVRTLAQNPKDLTGPARNWDFSTFNSELQSHIIEWVNPKSTPYYNQFEAADITEHNEDSQEYRYYSINNNYHNLIGLVRQGTPIIFEAPLRFFKNGLSYQEKFEDTYVVNEFSKGNIEVEYDGFGTLILPYKTFENVIRLKYHTQLITQVGDLSDTATVITYYWFSEESHHPVLIIVENSTLLPSGQYSIEYKDADIIDSVKELVDNELKLYPNPVIDDLNIKTDKSILRFSIYDILGNRILNDNFSSSINLSQLNTGSYLIRLEIANSEIIEKFFIKR